MARLTASLFLALLSLRCATAVNGVNERLPVSSDPQGADVLVACENAEPVRAVTPAVVEIPRKADGCLLTMTKRGFVPVQLPIERVDSRALRANYLPGAILGLAGGVVGLFAALDWEEDVGAAIEFGFSAGFLAGTWPAMQIDRATGGAYKHAPSRVAVKLEPEE